MKTELIPLTRHAQLFVNRRRPNTALLSVPHVTDLEGQASYPSYFRQVVQKGFANWGQSFVLSFAHDLTLFGNWDPPLATTGKVRCNWWWLRNQLRRQIFLTLFRFLYLYQSHYRTLLMSHRSLSTATHFMFHNCAQISIRSALNRMCRLEIKEPRPYLDHYY